MDVSVNLMPPLRRRIAPAPDGRRAWQGSQAQRDWTASLETHAWDSCASSSYIHVLPHLVGLRPPPAALLKHFSVRLMELRRDAHPRRVRSHRFAALVDGLSGAGFRLRWVGKPHGDGATPAADDAANAEVAALKALLAALRLGMTPPYDARIAASLAFRIGLHPAYVWDEALLSHEMFLTLGWIGLLHHRGGGWMPAAVAEYLADVVSVDDVGQHHVSEPLLAAVMGGQELRIAVARTAGTRLRRDEAFLRWPAPAERPASSTCGHPSP